MIRNIFRKIKKVLGKEKQATTPTQSSFQPTPPSPKTIDTLIKGKPHRYGRISLGIAAKQGVHYRNTDPRKVKPTQRPLYPINDIRDTT